MVSPPQVREQAFLIFEELPMEKKEGFCDFKLASSCRVSWPRALKVKEQLEKEGLS
jgi:hypothetical protein